MAAPDHPDAHPNTARRGVLAIAFAGIFVSGLLGGAIGWGLVDTTCTEEPTIAQQLLEEVPSYEVDVPACGPRLVGGAVAGALVTSVGAGIVAGLMLRAQSEWRAHPPVTRARSAGTPPRT